MVWSSFFRVKSEQLLMPTLKVNIGIAHLEYPRDRLGVDLRVKGSSVTFFSPSPSRNSSKLDALSVVWIN